MSAVVEGQKVSQQKSPKDSGDLQVDPDEERWSISQPLGSLWSSRLQGANMLCRRDSILGGCAGCPLQASLMPGIAVAWLAA